MESSAVQQEESLPPDPILAQLRLGPSAWPYRLARSLLLFAVAVVASGLLYQWVWGTRPQWSAHTKERAVGTTKPGPQGEVPLPPRVTREGRDPQAIVSALAGAAALAVPPLLFRWLRRGLFARFASPARQGKRGRRSGWPYDRPLPRSHALLCLLAPASALTLAGSGMMALRWQLSVLFLAASWAAASQDLALAWRVLRERGCRWIQFRSNGVIFYGGRRAPAALSRRRLWLTSLGAGAVWYFLAVILMGPLTIGLGMLRSQFSDGPFVIDLLQLQIWRFTQIASRKEGADTITGEEGFTIEFDPGLALFYLPGASLLFAAVRVARVRRRAARELHRRLAGEADEARQIQLRLLSTAPPPVPDVQVASHFQAAHEVSGDFFLFPAAPPGTLRLVIGDVAGKGMPAALLANLAAGFLRAGAETAPDPAALLQTAGQWLRAARHERRLVAACAVELDVASRRLRWCAAGVPAPLLLSSVSVRRLPGAGIPLGGLSQITYQYHEEELAAGDLLLFYTDGLVEATGPLGEMFGRERVAAALRRLPPGCSPEETLKRLHAEVTGFIGEAPPYDDITAIALRIE